jgi:3-deoxy-manno-octulosonate cytidylyltransferase (CMP-KDO synthetase)
MKKMAVIPARWGSTRFEGKVLADLAGKPLVQHVWERACQCKSLDEIIIACDDERVLTVVKSFGAKGVLTSKDHSCGTDRIAEVVLSQDDVGIVLNIQGDEPLLDPRSIDNLIYTMSQDRSCQMATLIKVLDNPQLLGDPNVVKVIIDAKGYAIYFSRAEIPFLREKGAVVFYQHIGIYAFTREFLFTFKNLPRLQLEKAEKLEQLRAIENGYRIKTVVTEADFVGVDTPEDLKKVERLLS